MQETQEKILGVLQELVAAPSVYPPGNTEEISALIAKKLRAWGYDVAVAANEPGIDNVVASMNAASGSAGPVLAFNCHIDTVGVADEKAWDTPPYELTVKNGRAYGLGANNCKGPAASQLWVAEQIARAGGPAKGRVMFTFCGDEEALGPNGTAYLRDSGIVRPDMLVVGAQTENALITRERGVTWIELSVRGTASHAGQPESGDNAIMRMARLLCHLEKELFPAIRARNGDGLQSTINPGVICGGSNINVVPAFCSVAIDRRVLPVSESIDGALEELRGVLAGAGEPEGSFALRRLTGTNGFSAPQDGPLVSAFSRAISAVTGKPAAFVDSVGAFDGRFFADDGIEIVNFGPGEGNEGHKANESLPVDQLVQSALIQKAMVMELLGL